MTTYQVFIITATSSIIAATFSALISFFITTINQRRITKDIINEVISYHEKIYHRKNPEDLIKEHRAQCINLQEMNFIKKGIKIVLEKLGGNILPDLEGTK